MLILEKRSQINDLTFHLYKVELGQIKFKREGMKAEIN